MPTCGIEYAHIYTNQCFSGEHIESIRRLQQYESSIDRRNVVIRRIILLDDYSPAKAPDKEMTETFLLELAKYDALPDLILAESALVPYCQDVVSMIGDKRLKRRLVRYIESRGKFPCSLFIAAWYLLRLGAFGKPTLLCLLGQTEDLFTDRLMTILPNKFESPETEALEIIKSTESSELLRLIQHQFFQYECTAFASATIHCLS
jgi:hypothetical protein